MKFIARYLISIFHSILSLPLSLLSPYKCNDNQDVDLLEKGMERGAVCGQFKEKVSFCLLLAYGLVAFTFIGTIFTTFVVHVLSFTWTLCITRSEF